MFLAPLVSPAMLFRLQKLWWNSRRLATARRGIRSLADPSATIFILGLSRSGSTWLQETIGAWPDTLNLFEPIHARIPGTLRAVTLEDLAPNDSPSLTPNERDVLSGILTGRLLTPKTLQPGRLPLTPKRLCIKLINCTNGVARLTHDLPLRYKPLVILRHPCAHVASWKRLGWTDRFGQFEHNLPHLLAAHPHLRTAVSTCNSPIERMAASWCLGNHVALHTDPAGRWLAVRYESLRADPHRVLAEIFQSWSHPQVPPEVLASVQKPSRTTWRNDATTTPPPDSWTTDLTPEEEQTVYDTCARFGITVDRRSYAAQAAGPVT